MVFSAMGVGTDSCRLLAGIPFHELQSIMQRLRLGARSDSVEFGLMVQKVPPTRSCRPRVWQALLPGRLRFS